MRAQAILTHVVFEHSLRIRLNAESQPVEKLASAKPSSSRQTPTEGLVGKMINLTTTDLDNILDGRDFLVTCMHPFLSLQKGLHVLSSLLLPLTDRALHVLLVLPA